MKKNKLGRSNCDWHCLGVLVGWACHHFAGSEQRAEEIASYFSLVTDIFLRMIKMIIAPLVFATLVGGFCQHGQLSFRRAHRLESHDLVRHGFGGIPGYRDGPGQPVSTRCRPEHGGGQHAASPAMVNTADFSLKVFISHVFPRSIAEAMANNEILQIVVFSLFFGFALAGVKRAGYTRIVDSIEELAKVMFKITDFVMAFAPIGVFAAIASAIFTGRGAAGRLRQADCRVLSGNPHPLGSVVRRRLLFSRPLGIYPGQAHS